MSQNIIEKFKTCDELLAYLASCEIDQGVKYVHQRGFTQYHKSLEELGCDPYNIKKKVVKYIDDGIPFITVTNRAILYCQHGADQHVKTKAKYAESVRKKIEDDHSQMVKTRQLLQDSYKLDCPAKAYISRLVLFKSHKLHINTEWQKKMIRKSLQSCTKDEIQYEEVFMLEIPPTEAHRGHFTGNGAPGRQPMDERVEEKLVDLVINEGITDTTTMQGHLRDYVHTNIYSRETAPASPNKRLFPEHKTIYNRIYSTLARELTSTDDQVNCKNYLECLKKQHQVYFRPLEETTSENFLLVLQTKSQSELMRRYGDEICLLDATYKTTKYSLPMFFVVVPTNTTYQVIATFMVSNETSDAIEEALAILSEWNPQWKPSFWMTDCCAAEQNAVESVFKNAHVLLCDFHRMQAWNRFLVKIENGIPKLVAATLKKDYLIPLANSLTEADYKKNRQKLLDSSEWKSSKKFQAYMNQIWLSEETCQRWVHCFKIDRLMRSVRTNNGVETLNNSVKKFTKGPRQLNLLQFLKRLMTWHSRRYKRYCKDNQNLSKFNRRYSRNVPASLHQRPHRFIKHILRRLPAAKQLTAQEYMVTEGDNPRCKCQDFSRHSFPCKHIIKTWLTDDGELVIPDTLSNPWWTTDSSVIPTVHNAKYQCQTTAYSPEPSIDADNVNDDIPSEEETGKHLQEGQVMKKKEEIDKIHSYIRESLKQMVGFTYENTSIETAKDLLSQITQIKKCYLTRAKTASNIPVIPTPARKARKRKAVISISSKDSALRPKKRKPSKYSKQGELSVYIVQDLESCESSFHTRSDVAPLDSQTGLHDSSPSGVSIKVKTEPPSAMKETVMDSSLEQDQAKFKPSRSSKSKPVNMSFVLNPKEQLDSDIITEGLNLISKQYPDVITQDCLLIQRQKCFKPALQFNHGDFCQVLHMRGANHWVSVTNIAAKDSDVRYFDSLGLTPTLKICQAIASLVKTPSRKIRLRRENVQRQEGGDDCGLFALANLVEVLNGGDPKKCRFNQPKMRMHLFKCLSEEKWEKFPKQPQPVPRVDTADRFKSFSVYCICRMPWNPNGKAKEDMVECPECHEWYHKGCVRIPPTAYCPITGNIENYTCRPCIERGVAVL